METYGSVENWRIEWRTPPQLVCLTWDCACNDFTYAERGNAELIRYRAGKVVQVFALATLFGTRFDLPEHAESEAILLAFPREPGDKQVVDQAQLMDVIRTRQLVPLMELHDYDHDGRATEFTLPIGGVGCAFHGHIAVGISRAMPELHAFGTAAHPEEPIALPIGAWRMLRTAGHATYVDVPCDARGAATQTEIELTTDSAGIHLIEREYGCPRVPVRLLSRIER